MDAVYNGLDVSLLPLCQLNLNLQIINLLLELAYCIRATIKVFTESLGQFIYYGITACFCFVFAAKG